MRNYRPILVVGGEPNSIFLEIFFKTIKSRSIKSPIILLVSLKVFLLQMKKLKASCKYKIIKFNDLKENRQKLEKINLIDIEYSTNKAFKKISHDSKNYIKDSFEMALQIIKLGITNKLINGPISKKFFLEKKYLGITELLAKKTNSQNFAMLIYNKSLSVSPLTTHLPLKMVNKKLNIKMIINKIQILNEFYISNLKIRPKIALLGLNPHCESTHHFNEDEKILKPAVIRLKKKGVNIYGPISADTAFLKNNRKKFNLIAGMYHDQVLTPIKTIFEYDAINITVGLPFIRISPDHGPNEKMIGKNVSNYKSLLRAFEFLDF